MNAIQIKYTFYVILNKHCIIHATALESPTYILKVELYFLVSSKRFNGSMVPEFTPSNASQNLSKPQQQVVSSGDLWVRFWFWMNLDLLYLSSNLHLVWCFEWGSFLCSFLLERKRQEGLLLFLLFSPGTRMSVSPSYRSCFGRSLAVLGWDGEAFHHCSWEPFQHTE